jgi:hypothetical protein
MIPAVVDGQEMSLQLDTGASTCFERAMLDWLEVKYEVTASAAGWNGWSDALVARLPEIKIGGVAAKDAPVIIHGPSLTADNRAQINHDVAAYRATHPDGLLPCGTLGADFFAGKSLYLDFAAGRFGVFDKQAAIDGTTVPITLCGSRPVLNVEAPVKLMALFDTGSSSLQLVAREGAFTALTGAVPGDDPAKRLTGQSWGQDISFEVAECTVKLTVGPLRLPITKVYTSPWIDQLNESTKGQADAIIGNEAFRGRIVLVNFARKTFTVADPK